MGTIKTDEIDVGAIPLAGTIGGDEQILVVEESRIRVKQLNQSGIVTATTDAVTGGITNIFSGSTPYFGRKQQLQETYKLASFGDSRANVNSAAPDISGSTSSLAVSKGPSWTAGYRGDTELQWNYGVSGDSASGWNSAARTGGKTVRSFAACGANLVHIQYGVNDIIGGNGTTPTAATIYGYLKSLVMEGVKSGMAVVFESILPCTSAGWTSGGSGTAAQKKAIALAVNAEMQSWIASVPMAAYADTAALMTDADGYATAAYYTDTIHLNNVGAALSGKTVAVASKAILPVKPGVFFYSGLATGPNFLDSIAPVITSTFSGVAGTFAANAATFGMDVDYGPYVEWILQALTLSSGEATFWGVIGADVGDYGATGKYDIAANDVLQGSGRILIDDGAGGTPSGLNNFVFRQRLYYQAGGGVYADWGSYAVPSTQSALLEKVNLMLVTPRVTTTTASAGIEPPTHVKGYGIHVYVSVSQTSAPIRLRVYSPLLRKRA